MILEVNTSYPQPRKIKQMADAIRQGKIVVYPTDSAYAFGCDPFNRKVVDKMLALRKVPKDKLLTLICSDLSQVSQYGFLSNTSHKLVRRCLPGPYTFILLATKLVPRMMLTKRKTIGIRIPDHPIVMALVEEVGHPIINLSVKFGDDQLADPEEIEKRYGNQVEYVIDGGLLFPSPSSVVDLTDDVPEVLREGQGDVTFFGE